MRYALHAMWRWRVAVSALLLTLVVLPACGGYQLQGRVVEGPATGVYIVDRDDPRLTQGRGVSGIDMSLTLDARRLTAKPLGSDRTRSDGSFSIGVSEFGAGFLEHEVRLSAQAQGYHPASQDFLLPSSRRRVLVVLRPQGTGWGEEDQQRLQRTPEGRGLIDETMQWGEPYLD